MVATHQIVDFLVRNIHRIHPSSAGGPDLVFPAFDLMPFDYLESAEEELVKSSSSSRINCVANLKRAVECEIDTASNPSFDEPCRELPEKAGIRWRCGNAILRDLNRQLSRMPKMHGIGRGA